MAAPRARGGECNARDPGALRHGDVPADHGRRSGRAAGDAALLRRCASPGRHVLALGRAAASCRASTGPVGARQDVSPEIGDAAAPFTRAVLHDGRRLRRHGGPGHARPAFARIGRGPRRRAPARGCCQRGAAWARAGAGARRRLDFDGVAKGWAVDRCVGLLRKAGITRALISLGESSAAAIGARPGASSWELTVRGPGNSDAVGTLRLRDQAISISATFGGPVESGQHTSSIRGAARPSRTTPSRS